MESGKIVSEVSLPNGLRLITFSDNYKEIRNEANEWHNPNGPAVIFPNGDEIYYINNLHHRVDGPAVNREFIKCWKVMGKNHREYLPAVITDDYIAYYVNNQLHNPFGPAMIYANGTRYYYLNGKQHRMDGPAVVIPSKKEEKWYIDGMQIEVSTQEDFERYLKLNSFW